MVMINIKKQDSSFIGTSSSSVTLIPKILPFLAMVSLLVKASVFLKE